MGYDRRPDTIVEEKRAILAQAVEENWILFFYHDPKVAAARAERDGDGFRLGEIVEFE